MISRFQKYLKRKKLTLNAEKSKVMIFKKEGERRRWKSGGGMKKDWKKSKNSSI